MDQSAEIVVTGLGVVSPIGIGTDSFWTALAERRSGVAPLTLFDPRYMPVGFGGQVDGFEPKQHVKPRKSLKVMCREIQTAFASATMAMDEAGLAKGAIDPDRLGVVFGSQMFYSDAADLADAFRNCFASGEFVLGQWGQQAMSEISPLWMLKYLPNMPACHVGIAHDARGPNNSITLGDVSSLLAIAEGASVIQRGWADAMIVGGTGSRLNVTGLLWRGDSIVSHRTDDPAAASRPFDANRDGMVDGEGAAALVIESRRHAEARGATVLARVLGHGSAFETRRNGKPGSGMAIRYSIRQALRSAGIEPAQVGHVNAHGLSTIDEDPVEAQAIREILGDVPVTAPKSFFGNLGAGSGAVELIASLLGLGKGVVPVTLNYHTPDPACPVDVIHGEPRPVQRPVALALNQSRTGQAAAVVVASP